MGSFAAPKNFSSGHGQIVTSLKLQGKSGLDQATELKLYNNGPQWKQTWTRAGLEGGGGNCQ